MIIGEMSQYFFGLAICFSSLFLVLLVLVQRGRGGGLTGALGGPGGQSAFGTKAGDLFTKITVGVAAAWIFLCASSVYFLKTKAPPKLTDGSATSNTTSSIGGTDDDSAGSSETTDSTTPAGTAEVISEDAFATDAGDESEAAGEEAAADAATNENTEPNEGADGTGPEEDTGPNEGTDASSTGSDQ